MPEHPPPPRGAAGGYGIAAQSGRGRLSALPSWVDDAREACAINVGRHGVTIATLEGVMRAEPDDWIIRGIKGELYPCKPDVFAATYEVAE